MRLTLIILLFPLLSAGQETVTMKQYVDMQNQLTVKYIEAVTEGMKRFTDGQVQAQQEAINKANAAMEKRLDGVNEFREQLKDQAGTFITRSELFGWIIALIGVLFGIMNYVNKKKEEVSKFREGGAQDKIKKQVE